MSILHFWKSTKKEIKNLEEEAQEINHLEILVPKDRLAERLRQHYIPKLIEIVEFEQSFKSENTLKQVLTMLFRYDELTFNYKKKDINDPKIIGMLPIMVKIAQKFLIISPDYRSYALDYT